ncbi:MFS transporter [Solicola sp. PLA-1-18]|uniref:MFS transporter n=1 Tax=Solicola sp. PLA-1-18 TaxID=3380532 RepID=UPI003B7CA301
MRRVWANRTYRHLLTAQVVALVGTGLLTVALGLLAYDLAPRSASAVLGAALTIKIAAYVVVSPLVATVAEPVPRRVLLVGADVVRAGVALLLPFVDAVWQVYVLVVVLQAASATFTPAFQAVIPAVLPDERDYTRALSLSRLAYDLESLLSPVLAGLLLTVVSYHGLFVGTVAGFVASALLVVTTRLPDVPVPPREERFASRVTRGTRTFWAVPQLRALLALDLVVAAATALVLVDTVVVVRQLLGRDDSAVAAALAAYGTGSMIVALALPRVLDRVAERTVMMPAAAVLVVGVAVSGPLLAVVPASSWPLVLVLWAVLGAATSAVLTPSARLLRRHSREAERPAVFAAQFSLSHACYLITYPVAGWVGAAAGVPVAALLLAAVGAVGLAVAAVSWPAAGSSAPSRAAAAAH